MRRGFTLIELLVTIGIVAVLATVVVGYVLPARVTARDGVRKATLNTMGRYLWADACYAPTARTGEYDLKVIYDEIIAAKPEIKQFLADFPKDPRAGSASVSGYRYIYDATAGTCALFANLEKTGAEVTLPALAAPTAGGGTGVLSGAAPGVNGTDRYYQVSR